MYIDAADVDNELAVVEYVEDIYKFYKLTEGDSRVHDYMDSQPEINSKMRSIPHRLVDREIWAPEIKVHGLVVCGDDDGAVECFDMRVRSSVGRINAVAPAGDIDQEVTAIEFDGEGGYFMAVGSSAGKFS
ncbi:unnamed protein product [Camellia sinensis]